MALTKHIISKNGESIYDVCIRSYTTLDFVLQLCIDNGLNSIEDSFPLGKDFIFDPALIPAAPGWGQQFSRTASNLIQYIAQQGQSIYDICLQTYGSLDRLIKLCIDNGLSGIEDSFSIGKIFIFDSSLIFNLRTYKSNLKQSIIYSTGTAAIRGILYESGDPILLEDGSILLHE